jgi:Transposase, Mutator family
LITQLRSRSLANVLDKLPKRLQPKAKQALHAIMEAPTRAEAAAGIDAFAADYDAKYPKAVASLRRDQAQLLTFYDFPAEHWRHLRTTDEIDKYFFTHSIFLGRSPTASRHTAAEQAPHQKRGPRRRPVDGARGSVIRRSRDVVTAGAPASGRRVSRTRALLVRRWRARDHAAA